MFSLNNISKSYLANSLFEDLSFSMQKKMHVGLIGRNGTGKSTLFRLLMGVEEADSGTISFPKGYKVGWLEQHVHFTEKTVLKEAIKGSGLPEERFYEAERILCGLGFSEEDLEKEPSTFSGGYHLRLNLAKALIKDPDCLLLDEPTNYLDIVSIRFLERFLAKFPKEFIIISHDQSFLDRVCTHTMALHRKKLHFTKGSCKDLYEKINEEEKVYEKTREKLEKKKEHMKSYVERFGAKATKAKQAQSRLKQINKMELGQKLSDIETLEFSFQESPFYGRLMLEAKNLTFSYDKPLIENFSLEVEKGERIAIIGKNARGKSTLLRLFIEDLLPKEGSVTHKKNLELGYFGQTHIERLDTSKTIEQEIAEANPKLQFTDVKKICGVMMFSQDLSTKKIDKLSGGERSRVLLGKIIAKPTNLLILDEPTHHLDMESISALVYAVNNSNHSLIMVTHDENILRQIPFTKIVYCHDKGQTHFLGNYDEFLEKVGFEEEKNLKKQKKENSSFVDSKKRSLLKRKIQKAEQTLEKKENELKKLEEKLVEVSSGSDLNEIDIATKNYNDLKEKIDLLYEELGHMYTELD